jgi:hypothetical protein
VLHARQRSGRANTARGAARFVDELAARVRRAGASGELTAGMDSGFWSAKTIRAGRRHRIHYSITVRQTKPIQQARRLALGSMVRPGLGAAALRGLRHLTLRCGPRQLTPDRARASLPGRRSGKPSSERSHRQFAGIYS